MNKDLTFLLEHFEFTDTPQPQLRIKTRSDDYSLIFNGFNDVIASVFHSITFKIGLDPGILLDLLQNALLIEKSDCLKQEYLHFLLENMSYFCSNNEKMLDFIKILLDQLREALYSTNTLYKCTLIRAITNTIICIDGVKIENFHYFLSILQEIINDLRQNRFVRSIASNSLLEIEDFYPSLSESEIQINILDNSFQQKTQIDLSQSFSLRNYSMITNSHKENSKNLTIFDLYKSEKSQNFADLLLLLLQITMNKTKKCIESDPYKIPVKLQELIKKLISHIISDLNFLSYFTKIIVLEKLCFFLNLMPMPAKVILPLYSNMLRSQGSVFVLCNLLILKEYKKDLDDYFRINLVQRLFYDVKDENLSINEKTLLLFWIINLKKFENFNEINPSFEFQNILIKNYWDLLPKPNDNYILKEKKILAFLYFSESNQEIDPLKVIGIILNFQIFKQFTIFSDIVDVFFRILFVCIQKIPFEKHLKHISDCLFEILQHKPKFSSNTIDLFQKLSIIKGEQTYIYPLFLDGFSKFLIKLEPASKISQYFDLINFVIEEPLINCEEILFSILRLVKSMDESFREGDFYKINENIMFICKKALRNFPYYLINNRLIEIFGCLAENSLDFAIKDTAVLYKSLLENLKKNKLIKVFFRGKIHNPTIFSENNLEKITVLQEAKDFSNRISLKISVEERKELGLFDNASAIFGNFKNFNNFKKIKQNGDFLKFLNANSFLNSFSVFNNFYDNSEFSLNSNDLLNVISNNIINNEEKTLKIVNFEKKQEEIQLEYQGSLRSDEKFSLNSISNTLKSNYNLLLNSHSEIICSIKTKIINCFLKEFIRMPPFITIPLNLSSKQLNIYALTIIFANSQNFKKIPSIFIPFLAFSEKLIYKILLNIRICNPVPMRIETGFFFTTNTEKICLVNGGFIDLKFEDMFLPLDLSENLLNSISKELKLEKDINLSEKILIKMTIFENFWNNSLTEACKILNNSKKIIINLMESRLKQFWIHEPIKEKLKEIEILFGDIYNETESFDFQFEKESIKEEILICPIIILLPDKFYLLMKIAVDEKCSVVRIKTNRWEILKHIDSYFDDWNIK